jgi:hypothetical protein
VNKELLKETYGFVLGFVTVIISLSAFKDELKSIIIDIGFIKFSLSNYFLILILVFTISLYIYAIDYSLSKTKMYNRKMFRILVPSAYFLFILCIVSPLVIFIIFNIYQLSLFISRLKVKIDTALVANWAGIIGSIITALFSVAFSGFKIKQKRMLRNDELENSEIKRLDLAIKLYSDGYYSQSILESVKILEIHLLRMLELKGLNYKNQSLREIIHYSRENKIIDERLYNNIRNIMELRNIAAHLDVNHTKEQAAKSIETIKSIIKYSVENTVKQ